MGTLVALLAGKVKLARTLPSLHITVVVYGSSSGCFTVTCWNWPASRSLTTNFTNQDRTFLPTEKNAINSANLFDNRLTSAFWEVVVSWGTHVAAVTHKVILTGAGLAPLQWTDLSICTVHVTLAGNTGGVTFVSRGTTTKEGTLQQSLSLFTETRHTILFPGNVFCVPKHRGFNDELLTCHNRGLCIPCDTNIVPTLPHTPL